VLFTDLVGSTELMQRLGDEQAERVRRAHFRALRDAVAARGGLEVKSVGDGLMVVFSSALDAVACAVAMQQAVHAHNQLGEDPPLGVRVGLDVGEPIREEADYFGTPVVIAKRLCDSAQGGQIIVSELVRRLAGSRGDVTFRTLDPLRLKGLADPLAVCEVEWAPAAAPPPPPSLPDDGTGSIAPAFLASGEASVFVGRSREMNELRSCRESASAGHRELALLAGEPGIGKTRLATEFLRETVAGGSEALASRIERSGGYPYQPFIEALSSRSLGDLRKGLGNSVAERMTEAIDLSRGDEPPERVFRALVALLTETYFASPVTLLFDDLQWADRATLELLEHIMRRPQQSRLLVVATYREIDVTSKGPLAELLADLRRDRLFRHIAVGGLDQDEVGSLVASWAGQHAPPELTRVIHARTDGNPFFVEEMLRDLADTGAMYDEDGRLRDDLSQTGVPQGAKEMIMRRLSRLSERCNSVLTIAAVIGHEFGMDALRRASGLPDEQLLEGLDEAVRATVILEAQRAAGRYSFTHALIHEALYDELTTTRRVHLHGQTLQYADSDGVKLAYEVLGASGPHVIAIGLSNCPAVRTRNWNTAQRWDHLARRCRVILYDRRGVGCSETPDRGYSLGRSLEDVRAVLDAAGVERAILWGATDGGPLAIAFAVHYPERVAGLLLLGTTAKYTSDESFPLGANTAAVEAFQRTDAVDRGRAVSQLSQSRMSNVPGAAALDAVVEVLERVPRSAWSKLIMGVGAGDARSLLTEVRTPTLIVHDPDNSYIPVEAAHHLHDNIAGSELLITDDWGKPLLGDTVYDAIDTFIERVTG
jgi:class 3 adenylate cyclase/pimeloyl-ACP methyl ester carboxylesterase